MKTLLWFALTAAAVFVAAMYVGPRFVSARESAVLTAALGICLAAGFLALLPLAIVAPRHPDYILQAGLASMLIRLFLTILGGVAYLKWYAPPRAFFLNTMVFCYLGLLAFETFLSMRLVKRHWRPPHSV